MMDTRYGVSFKVDDVPGGWLQAGAAACQVRITRIVCAPPLYQRQLVIDEVSLAQVADYVRLCSMSSAEVVLSGLRMEDERVRLWVAARMRGQAQLSTIVVAHPAGAVASEQAALVRVTWGGPPDAPMLGDVTFMATELHASQAPSLLGAPLDWPRAAP